jgi:hypothetical protein
MQLYTLLESQEVAPEDGKGVYRNLPKVPAFG